MIDKEALYEIDTVKVTNDLWVLSQRYRAYKFWPEGFELTNHYFIKITLKSKDPCLSPDKEYTGKDAARMLNKEYITSAQISIGNEIGKQAKIYEDWLRSVVDIPQKNNGTSTKNSERAAD